MTVGRRRKSGLPRRVAALCSQHARGNRQMTDDTGQTSDEERRKHARVVTLGRAPVHLGGQRSGCWVLTAGYWRLMEEGPAPDVGPTIRGRGKLGPCEQALQAISHRVRPAVPRRPGKPADPSGRAELVLGLGSHDIVHGDRQHSTPPFMDDGPGPPHPSGRRPGDTKKDTLAETRWPSSTPAGLAAGLGWKKLTLRQGVYSPHRLAPFIGSPAAWCDVVTPALGGAFYDLVAAQSTTALKGRQVWTPLRTAVGRRPTVTL